MSGDRRRPGRFRRFVLRPLLWSVALLVVAAFLLQLFAESRRARDWAAREIEQTLEDALGRDVAVDDVHFVLFPFRLEIWGLRIGGLAPPDPRDDENGGDGPLDAPPFLVAPHSVVELDLASLRQRRAHLRLLRVERPELYLEFFDPEGSNLVRRPGGDRADAGAPAWEVWIDQVEIDRARIFLEQNRSELSLDSGPVRTRFRGLGPGHLEGRVVARDVGVRLPDAEPVEVAVAARTEVVGGRIVVHEARVTRPGLDARVDGACDLRREARTSRKCVFRTRGESRGGVLAELGYFRDLAGAFRFDGELAWRPEAVGWRGRASSDRLVIFDRRLDDVEAEIAADRFGLRIDLESARHAGGSLGGLVELERDADSGERRRGRWDLGVAITFGDLRVDPLLADLGVRLGEIGSRIGGRFRYRAGLDAPRRGDGRGEVEIRPDASLPGLPLEGGFPLRVESGVLLADRVSLRTERQSALADAQIDLRDGSGTWRYEVETRDVGELLDLVLRRATDGATDGVMDEAGEEAGERAPWLPTEGTGRLVGTLYLGDGAAPATEVAVRLEDVRAPKIRAERVVGRLAVDGRGIRDLRLDLGDEEEALHVTGSVPFDLEGGDPDDATKVRLQFDAFHWPMAEIQPWLDRPLPLDGAVSGRLDLELDAESSRGRLRATADPASLLLADVPFLPRGIALDALATRLRWDAEAIEIESFDLRAPAGAVSGAGRLDRGDGALDVRFAAAGLDLEAAPLAALRPHPELGGDVVFDARLGGRLDAPELEIHARAEGLALAGRPLPGETRLDAVWAEGRLGGAARLADTVVIEGGGALGRTGEGGAGEAGEGGARRADLGFTVRVDDLAAVLDLFAGAPEDLGGRVAGELRIDGPLDGPPRVRLLLDPVDLRLRGTDEVRHLRSSAPVVVDLEDRDLVIRELELVEPATESLLRLDGSVGLLGPSGAALELNVEARLDASWIRPVADLPVEGSFEVGGRLGGTLDAPELYGRAEVRDGVLRIAGMPPDLVGVEGAVLARGDHLQLEGVEGEFAGGDVFLEGRVELREPRYRLTLEALGIDLEHPDGWSLAGDAELVLRSADGGHRIGGRADLERLGWTRDLRFDLGAMVRQLLRRERLEVAAAEGTLSRVALDVHLLAPDAVRVRNNLARMDGSADLFLRGTLAAPVLYGEVEVDPGGTLVYNGVDYEVERGRILFVDPYELEAEIDFVAGTRVRDFDVTLAAFGSLERLETRFSSEPPLPDVELFRLLAGGDVRETQADLVDPRLARVEDDESTSAASFLYGQAASAIGDRVGNLFGLDKFRIDPLTGSDRDNLSKARVTVGKRLSKDIFLTYSLDPSSNESSRLQIEWRLAEGLTLVLTQNGDNTYSADARWDTAF